MESGFICILQIGATSGALRSTGKPFDREEKDEHQLVVEVRSEDHSRVVPRVAHVTVKVQVMDLNDNSPVFIGLPYHAVMAKDLEQDSTIIQVKIHLQRPGSGSRT